MKLSEHPWRTTTALWGYAHRGGAGTVAGFDQFWRQAADSAHGKLPEPESPEWKSMLGRFVADAVIAHVRKGLAMVENGDGDAACTLLGQTTSAEHQAAWAKIAPLPNAHGFTVLPRLRRQRVATHACTRLAKLED